LRPAYLTTAALLLALSAACSGGQAAPPADAIPSATATNPTALPTPEIVVESSVTTEYYEVLGKTTQEILSYIKENGPVDGNGSRASGLTRAEWSLEWSRTSTSRTCTIREMTISMDLVIILPALDVAALAPNLQQSWQGYASNIATHEQRHVDIYIEGAETLKQRMEEVTAEPDCATLEDRVTTIWEDQRALTNQDQDSFHTEDGARIEAKRTPFRDQIDLNNARLVTLIDEIRALDDQIAALDQQLEATAPQIEMLSEAIAAIEDEYDGISLPPEVQEQYESLRSQYIALLPAYNAVVAQYNDAVGDRNDLAKEHGQLTNETNTLIETYNWLN
jgi:predicted secreted Zn-dependent protease